MMIMTTKIYFYKTISFLILRCYPHSNYHKNCSFNRHPLIYTMQLCIIKILTIIKMDIFSLYVTQWFTKESCSSTNKTLKGLCKHFANNNKEPFHNKVKVNTMNQIMR